MSQNASYPANTIYLNGSIPVYANLAGFPATGFNGQLGIAGDTLILYVYSTDSMTWELYAAGAVAGPVSSTDNALARFDGATGHILQNSNAILTDAGALSLATSLTVGTTLLVASISDKTIGDGIQIQTLEAHTVANSGLIQVATGGSEDGNTGSMLFTTGIATGSGNTGDISFTTGAALGAGTRGVITLDADETHVAVDLIVGTPPASAFAAYVGDGNLNVGGADSASHQITLKNNDIEGNLFIQPDTFVITAIGATPSLFFSVSDPTAAVFDYTSLQINKHGGVNIGRNEDASGNFTAPPIFQHDPAYPALKVLAATAQTADIMQVMLADSTTVALSVSAAGNLSLPNAGNGIRVAEGSNAKQGIATMVLGTVTVSNTSITANSRIMLTAQTATGTVGAVRVSARVNATSFTITSYAGDGTVQTLDISDVAYEIFEPA